MPEFTTQDLQEILIDCQERYKRGLEQDRFESDEAFEVRLYQWRRHLKEFMRLVLYAAKQKKLEEAKNDPYFV